MKHYIDKSAVVAEIESVKKRAQILGDNAINSSMQQFYDGMKQGCVDILSSINTFEVKEVDLEKEIKDYFKNQPIIARSKGIDYQFIPSGEEIAKHFFELGLRARKGE